MSPSTDGFSDLWIEEDPLREWILKAYHEHREAAGEPQALLQAIRYLLSGPLGGPSIPGEYFFLTDPEQLLPDFGRGLNHIVEGLARAVYDPLTAAIAEKEETKEEELAPNVSLYVASVSGPIALKTELDETLVCALVSTALLTLARLGRTRVDELLQGV